jgi:hypothetical protein
MPLGAMRMWRCYVSAVNRMEDDQLGCPGGAADPFTSVELQFQPRAIGAVGARFPDTEEVTGSNPVSPTSNIPGRSPDS